SLLPFQSEAESQLWWFFRGTGRIFSVPSILLMSSFVGFAGLAIQSGITLAQAVFMTITIWALPAKVVLIGAISANAALPAIILAVGLSSVRLTPMVVALLPELKGPNTRKLTLDRKSTRLNSSHVKISYAVFCLKKKNITKS